jgi:hypothetical protein
MKAYSLVLLEWILPKFILIILAMITFDELGWWAALYAAIACAMVCLGALQKFHAQRRDTST